MKGASEVSKQRYNKLGTPSFLASMSSASQMPNCYLGHSAAEPDELGYCFDFTLGKASGME